VSRWDREPSHKQMERLQQATYDILRALEIVLSSLTTTEDQIGMSHLHSAINDNPRKQAIDHLESAARLAGIGQWTYEYLLPEFKTRSQKTEKATE